MKKFFVSGVLLIAVTLTTTVSAEHTKVEYSPGFAALDLVIYRPIGIAATIAGGALFAGLSPLTAIAEISPPHDAFDKTVDFMVIKPFNYTFSRPLGEWEWPVDE